MKSALQPVKQNLTSDEKLYLSRKLAMKDKFSKHQPEHNENGIFIIYGENAKANLEKTLSILDFLEEQNVEGYYGRQTLMYWTKNSASYVDDENIDNEYHFLNIKNVAESCRSMAYQNPHPVVYMDEIVTGLQVVQAKDLSRSGAMVFLSVIATNFEEALKNFSTTYAEENIVRHVVGSMSSIDAEITHIF